jgi:hypothetical protein
MTIPLSSTRSRTSIKLVPTDAHSTGIEHSRYRPTSYRNDLGASEVVTSASAKGSCTC